MHEHDNEPTKVGSVMEEVGTAPQIDLSSARNKLLRERS